MPNPYRRFRTSLSAIRHRFRPEPVQLGLVSEVARHFFHEATDDRVKSYVGSATTEEKSDEELRKEWFGDYSRRLEDFIQEAIKDELRKNATVRDQIELKELQRSPFVVRLSFWAKLRLSTGFLRLRYLSVLKARLPTIKIPRPLNDQLCTSPEEFVRLTWQRGTGLPRLLTNNQGRTVLGLILRGVQETTLAIVRDDYIQKDTRVRESTQKVFLNILKHVDQGSRKIHSPITLTSLAEAETELRVLIARAGNSVCLPLRSIPTSPLLGDSSVDRYIGRPDEETLKLSRQIRHADGTILVTGYRGVGKSSFVNRVVFHAMNAQSELPQDSWLIVPVNVNLAKVAGVQNILRITLRRAREQLLEPGSLRPQRIGPNRGSLARFRLPLDKRKEVLPLQEAYIRATYKVTLGRATTSERKTEAGASFTFDPGKFLGPFAELGKFLEGGIKKTRTEKINRELSLLDYDESAAEEDLARLIRSLADPRPLAPGGPQVRIKLVFIFDELDKMDLEQGFKPMIEGLKNLFLEKHSIFILVTSKKFYYELIKERAVEDAMLSSYFSSIVHVPLLSFDQAKDIVTDWIDWKVMEKLKPPSTEEQEFVELLSRVLVYRSFGNPRDIIRELRRMQEWADTTQQPYLTDKLSSSLALKIHAGLQLCIEQTLGPQESSSSAETETDGAVTLASDRLVGDESRLEQIRRGLYILSEELINRETLTIFPPKGDAEADPPKESETPAELKILQQIQKDNFSLLSLADVQGLARELGGHLSRLHLNKDLFPDGCPDLFRSHNGELQATTIFYSLTGRQARAAADGNVAATTLRTSAELIAEAQGLIAQGGWAAHLSALNIIRQLGLESVPRDLVTFVWNLATDKDGNVDHRMRALERITPKVLLTTATDLPGMLKSESDERILATYFRLMAATTEEADRQQAAATLIELFRPDAEKRTYPRLTDGVAIDALKRLQTMANKDVISEVLDWLCAADRSTKVQATALEVVTTIAQKNRIDLANVVVSNSYWLRAFTASRVLPSESLAIELVVRGENEPVLRAYLREQLLAEPFKYLAELLNAAADIRIDDLLASLWEVAFQTNKVFFAEFIFRQLKTSEGPVKERLIFSLRAVSELESRVFPYLREHLETEGKYSEEERQQLSEKLEEIRSYAFTVQGVERLREALGKLPDAYRGQENVGLPTKPPNIAVLSDTIRTRSWFVFFSFMAFIPGVLSYRRDLPAGATAGTIIKSRLLLLFLDICIFLPVTYFFDSALIRYRDLPQTESYLVQGSSLKRALRQNQSGIYVVMLMLTIAIAKAHAQFFTPLDFWNQTIQFLINVPAMVCFYLALRPEE